MKQFNVQTFFKSILPDAVSLGGIALLGYGLFIFEPWVSYSASGFLISVYALYRTGKMPQIDIRDVLFVCGLVGLGYGLYLKSPWIAFSVCGAILMLSGYIMRDK